MTMIETNMRKFRFEVSRKQYCASDSPIFAEKPLRKILQRDCVEFVIWWKFDPKGMFEDVLVIAGEGPLDVVSCLQAFVMGHDWWPLYLRLEN